MESSTSPLVLKLSYAKSIQELPISQRLPQFLELVLTANEAINDDIYPSLIHEGSSGSYYVFSKQKKIIGIFKPKNEEPYGKLNPKWLKWLHRIFFPCCFGRSCIIPNKGYMSEAGAYLVDQALDLNVVPPTFVTFIASPTFNYSQVDRTALHARIYLKTKFNLSSDIHCILSPKIGSFQKYVEGYSSAYSFLQGSSEPLPPGAEAELQFLLEKMIVLDYITRNTDRGDNWLIKISKKTRLLLNDVPDEYDVELAAIDNGLSFPFKHPDSWRSCKTKFEIDPFHWAFIPQAKRPFSQRIRDLVIPKLSEVENVESLIASLEELVFSAYFNSYFFCTNL
ncbi:Phosphatidylinositol 4-kinase type 2-alpha [Thelohanellus kitauei]|uniref:Phosphatidylinositol 4-kinase type 2 n=1 Tax=Thelohanellus kitauei TaxID=669202 RepID=A0A0C2N257_THEKT|nr:Phosphatidylinositol 4-kinase type 2-alpha [Thelohanellus kitauei]